MKKNMGLWDRLLRLLIASIIGVSYLAGTISGIIGLIWLVLGVLFALTSAISFCPLYASLDISSSREDNH